MWNLTGSMYDGTRQWRGPDLEHVVEALGRNFNIKSAASARIGIAVEHQPSFIAATVAGFRSRAVPTFLSSRAPRDGSVESQMLLQRIHDADLQLVVLDHSHAAVFNLPEYRIREVELPGRLSLLVAEHEYQISRHPNPDGAAVIIYTAGSTGEPKGVVLSEASVQFVLTSNSDVSRWGPDDRLLSALPLSHVAGFVNVLSALTKGASVFSSPSFTWPVRVLEFCVEKRISVAGLVPYYTSRLVSSGQLRELRSLRLLVSSAAPIVTADIECALDALPELEVLNAYGLTEAFRSIVLMPNEIPDRLPSIGRPIEGVQVQIKNPTNGRVLGDEEEGELCIRGPNVMLGYWHNSAETATALRYGWLRTQDLARRCADGAYMLTGRNTHLINAGGEKLCCEVLERCLNEGCELEEVAVVGHDDGSGCDSVIAFAVARESLALENVRAACSRKVHSAFWPSRLILLEALPRTETGKLDRHALAALCHADS